MEGSQHGGGDRDDGLLGAAAGFEPVEEGVVVAGLDAHRRPGGLHQERLEPGGAVAQLRRATLARALVVAGAEPGPGDEMSGGWEAAHVKADLGHDHARRDVAQAGHRGQPRDGLAKGLEPLRDLLVDRGDGCIDAIRLDEMQAQQQAPVRREPAPKRLDKLRARGPHPRAHEVGELAWVVLAGRQGIEDDPPALAHDVGEDRAELEVGGLQQLIDALDVTGLLAGQLLAGTGEVAQGLLRH